MLLAWAGTAVLAAPVGAVAPVAVPMDCSARMAARPGAWRALPPETPARLRRTIERTGGRVHLYEAELVCDEVDAALCRLRDGEGGCLRVGLSDPDRGCEGEVAGPWCVRFTTDPEGVGDEATRKAILAALAQDDGDRVWRSVTPSPDREKSPARDGDPGAARAPTKAPSHGVLPYGLALLWLLVPWGLGGVAGRALARRQSRVRTGVWLAGGAVVLVAFSVAAWAPRLSTWDALGLGVVAASGLIRHGLGRQIPRRAVWAMVLSTLGAVLVMEGASRILLGPPSAYPPPSQARMLFAPEEREAACQVLYPDRYPDAVPSLDSPPGPVVLHIGDSMLYGSGLGRSETLTARLEALDPGTRHVNLGQPGTGTDHQLVLLRTWLERLDVKRIVLHLYPGNDLVDLDKPYACCGHWALTARGSEDLTWRCPEPDWRFPFAALLARSPPPYPLRVATGVSVLAAHLADAFSAVAARFEPALGAAAGTEEPTGAWERFEEMLTAIRDLANARAVALTPVVLPTRNALEAQGPEPHSRAIHRRMVTLSMRLGLDILDGWEPMATAHEESMPDLFHQSDGRDEHYGAAGHQLLAHWLHNHLVTRGQVQTY